MTSSDHGNGHAGPEEPDLAGLPGGDLVARGLSDLGEGAESPEAALVQVASELLGAMGLLRAPVPRGDTDAEIRLYERLAARHPDRDPYPIYCAWLEQLDSFLWAHHSVRSADRRRR